MHSILKRAIKPQVLNFSFSTKSYDLVVVGGGPGGYT